MGNSQTNEDSVGGRSMIGVTKLLSNGICWSIGEAERIKGSPPFTPEVIVVYHDNCNKMFYYGYLNAFI